MIQPRDSEREPFGACWRNAVLGGVKRGLGALKLALWRFGRSGCVNTLRVWHEWEGNQKNICLFAAVEVGGLQRLQCPILFGQVTQPESCPSRPPAIGSYTALRMLQMGAFSR